MTRISSPPALDYKYAPLCAKTTLHLSSVGLPCQHVSAWTCTAALTNKQPPLSSCLMVASGLLSDIHDRYGVCSEYKDRLHNCVADDGQGSLHLRFELRMSEVKGLIEAFSKKQVPHSSHVPIAALSIHLSLPDLLETAGPPLHARHCPVVWHQAVPFPPASDHTSWQLVQEP